MLVVCRPCESQQGQVTRYDDIIRVSISERVPRRHVLSLPDRIVHHTRHDGHETPTMPPFDDWNVIDDEEEEELQDTSVSLHGLVCCTE